MNRFLAALFVALILPVAAMAQQGWDVTTRGNLVPGNCPVAANKSQIQDSGIDCSGGAGAFALKDFTNVSEPAAFYNLGMGLGVAVAPGSLTLVGAGTGQAVGDILTLVCTGCTATTAPKIAVTTVSGGTITGATLINPGVFTLIPKSSAATVTLTQSASTGSGVNASWTASFGPIAAAVSNAALATAGASGNGNYFSGAEMPSGTYAGFEGTFVGDRAGSGFIGAANANTAVGHNAGGLGANAAGSATGSFNTFIGNDSGRDITGTGASNTGVGQSALRVVTNGGNNVGVGQGTLAALTTGNNNTAIGVGAGAAMVNSGGNVLAGIAAGNKITTGGNNNTILGDFVASTTLATGSNNVLIGTNGSMDTAAAGTSNTIGIGAGSTAIWTTTGAGTPSTAVSGVSGTLKISGGYTVATLPAAPGTGARAYVTDQLTSCAATGVALTGGGAVVCPAFYNGSAWVGG